MTIDDENSVYVGNLPYDSTEDTIRSVFDIYGQIIAVKIINDRGVGGKCYGFVTFTNPRSAVNAISDMDGRTVDGRVVKVNEVKTRGGGRSNFGRDNFRHNNNRDVEFDRGRDRDYGRERDRSRDKNREWSRDRDQGKERGYDRAREVDRSRDRFVDRDRGHDRDKELDDIDLEHERDHDQTNIDQEKEMIRRGGNRYKDQSAKLTNGGELISDKRNLSSDLSERHSREYPSGSSHGDHDQVAKQLDISQQKIEELQKEVIRMEERAEERGDHVSKLQEKSQKLEDALASARKLTSNRKKQLTKLYNCFLNVKDHGEKLRICEEELQSLVGSTLKELENHNGLDPDELLAN